MSYIAILKAQLKIDEGVRHMAYTDSVGKLSIGVGRNLDDKGIRDDEMELMLMNDIQEAEDSARALVSNFDSLSDERKAVVVNLSFNMGQTVLAQFTNTLRAINEGRFDDAADGMLASLWAKQVGARALRLSAKMRSG